MSFQTRSPTRRRANLPTGTPFGPPGWKSWWVCYQLRSRRNQAGPQPHQVNNLMEVSKIDAPRGEKNLVFVEQTKSSPSSSAGKGTRWGVNNVFSVRSLVGSGNKAAIVKKKYDAFMWRAVSNILSNAVGFQTCGQWPSEPDILKNDCVFPDLDTCAPVTTLLGTSTWELMPGKQTHLKTLIKLKKQIKNIETWPQRCQVTSQNRNFVSFVNQPPSLSCPGGVCVRQWKIAIRLSLRAKGFGLTQEKSRFFFPLPPPPPVCYVQPLYRAKGGSWGFKTALVNEDKYSFWTIFDFYVPSTLQHSRFSIWRRMTVRVIIQEPHPPLPLQNSCIQRCSTLWTCFVSWIRFKMSHPSVTKYYVECIDTVVFL